MYNFEVNTMQRFMGVARAMAWSLCVAAWLSISGCGGEPKETVPDLVPVTGKVTYQGKPLADAHVSFIPAEEKEEATEQGRILRPSGKTDAAGGYELSWGEHVGAPPGKYNVVVTALGPLPEDPEERAPSLIPEAYGNPKTSGLKGVVKDEETVINLDLQ